MPRYEPGLAPVSPDSQAEFLRRELFKLRTTVDALYRTIDILKAELNAQAVTVTTANE